MTAKGAPPLSAPGRFFEISTAAAPAAQSREFWLLNRSEADFHDADHRAPYQGRVRGYFGAKSQIRDGRSDPIILRRTADVCRRDGSDEILLSAVLQVGRETWAGEPDRMFRIQAGDLVVADLAKALTLDAGQYREINFRLSRPLVAAAIGRDPGFLNGRILPKTPLTAMLYANLRSFVVALPTMEESERAAALVACTEFALQTLDFVVHRFDGAADTPSDRLFEAAERLIERNLGLRRLSPDWLAQKLGCSRSAIYRLFRLHGHPVMEFISERRLRRACETLGDPDNAQTIADVASSCGFDDPSSFSRRFRQRFDCTPREARLCRSRP